MAIQSCERCGYRSVVSIVAKACPSCGATNLPSPSVPTSASSQPRPTALSKPPAPTTASAPPLTAVRIAGTPHPRGAIQAAAGKSSVATDRHSVMIWAGVIFCVLIVMGLGIPLMIQGLSQMSRPVQSSSVNTTLGTNKPSAQPIASHDSSLLHARSSARASMQRAELTAVVDPAIVLIQVKTKDGNSVGSGFLVDRHGTIVTNKHVVAGATQLTVRFNDGYIANTVKVAFLHPTIDFALLSVSVTGELPTPLTLAAEPPQKGEDMAAFGSPGGLSFSTSFGNVSALRKDGKVNLVQFTAPISPGNSGGPIVNMRGEVIGMTTFLINFENSQNLNFAISSIDLAELFLEQQKKRLIPK